MKINEKVLHQFYKIKIYSGAEALAAALFSCLVSGGCLWLLQGILYDSVPVYDELLTGGTIWDGYDKQGDLCVFYLLYVLIPFFFCLFLYLKHTLDGKICRIAAAKAEPTECAGSGGKKNGMLLAAAALFGIASVRAVETAAAAVMPGRRDLWNMLARTMTAMLLLAACGLAVYFWRTKKEGERIVRWLLALSQLCLPFQFLGYYRFYYQYESADGLIQLFASERWKWFCIALCFLFLACQIRHIGKRTPGIYLSSVMLLAAEEVMDTPEGFLSVDFFHNGEMAFPMQQLLSFDKLPYFDVDPIHGLCDYFYSLLNVVFFDGSYFSQNAAVQAAELFMALLLVFVMGKSIRSRYVTTVLTLLAVPYLVESAGVRYLLFFAGFFLLLGEDVRKDGRKFLWWWVMLCILGISWNVSIGAAMAVAFLPEALYRVIRDVIPRCRRFSHWEKREKRRYLTAYGLLLTAGVCYIPWFLQILRFLSENAGTTLYVNGTAVFGEDFSPVRTFAFLLPFLCALIYALAGSSRGKSAFVTMLSCLLVITNYACVRYDEGARLAVLAVFFMTLFAGFLLTEKTENQRLRRGMALCFLGAGVYLAQGYLPSLEQPMAVKEIAANEELEVMGKTTQDPVVYVSGESVGMSALGTGFMRGSTLNSLKNVQTVLNAEAGGDSYLDLTNKISHYVIFDKESVLSFTSAYNVSNRVMQEKAIETVKEERPRLILVSPLIQFDLAPVSLRSMDFYTTLIRMGYQPYVYGDVVYLADGDAALTDALDGRESLGQICHKEALGMLPVVWGASYDEDPSVVGQDRQELSTDALIRQESDQEVQITFQTAVEAKTVDFIKIVVKANNIADGTSDKELRMRFFSTIDSAEHSFVFSAAKAGQTDEMEEEQLITYLIPVGSSPFWQFSDFEAEGEISFYLSGISADAVAEATLIAVAWLY